MTVRLCSEARSALFRHVRKEEWRALSYADRARICTVVVSALLNKGRVINALNGGRLI